MFRKKSIKRRVIIFAVLMSAIVMSLAMLGLCAYNKLERRTMNIRDFLYSSLSDNLTSDDFVTRCISNNVSSAAIFLTDDYGICLCYDIDAQFYCIQHTGQVMRFQNIDSARSALHPKCEKVLYNRDKSLPQSPDELSLWVHSKVN